MLIRLFRSSQPGLLFIVPLLALVWYIPLVLNPAETFVELPQHAMPLYVWLSTAINKLPFIAQLVLSWLLISMQAIYVNQIIVKHELFPRLSFLPALFFVTLSVLFPEMMRIQPELFVNLILLMVMDKIFHMYKNPEAMREVFDCSFLLAVALLIQSSSLAFYFFLLLSIVILLPFYWRVWMISFIGFALPFYFISVYFFWTDKLGIFWNLKLPASFSFVRIMPLHFSTQQILLLSLVFFLLLFSILSVAKHFYKNVIRTRKYFQLIFILFFTGVICLLIAESISLQSMMPLVIPVSVLLAAYFLQIKKIALAEFFYLLLLGLMILVRFA